MTDEMLAEHTRQGSGTAFAVLVADHCDAVYRIAEYMCASARDAEDVTRETFLSAYRDIASWPSDRSFRIWLYGIAMKEALRQRQGASRGLSVPPEAFLPHFDVDGDLELPGAEWPDLARLEPMGLARFLREALYCMDDDVRAAFVLCDLVELPVEDAAQIVQSSPQVVRTRTHRARLMLRGFLDRLWSV